MRLDYDNLAERVWNILLFEEREDYTPRELAKYRARPLSEADVDEKERVRLHVNNYFGDILDCRVVLKLPSTSTEASHE